MIHFITGSKNKLEEIQAIVPGIEQLEMDLPEIQEIDPHKIIKAKLEAAFAHSGGEFLVEDTSLYMEAMNGLPGPLIKWFLQAIGNEGLVNLGDKLGNNKAVAKTLIGYAKSRDDIHYFEGVVEGSLVTSRVSSGYGWDLIFLPYGHEKTFAEMSQEEKNTISMRGRAAEKLRVFLNLNL